MPMGMLLSRMIAETSTAESLAVGALWRPEEDAVMR